MYNKLNFAQARKSRKLTQTQVAKKLGITRQTLSRIELGKRSLSAEQFFKLLDIFYISFDNNFYTAFNDGTNHVDIDPPLL